MAKKFIRALHLISRGQIFKVLYVEGNNYFSPGFDRRRRNVPIFLMIVHRQYEVFKIVNHRGGEGIAHLLGKPLGLIVVHEAIFDQISGGLPKNWVAPIELIKVTLRAP